MKWIVMAGLAFWLQHTSGANAPIPDVLLSVTHEGKTVAQAKRSDYTLPAVPLVDARQLEAFAGRVDKAVRTSPVDAVIGPDGRIVPERTGHRLNRDAFMEQFEAFYYGGEPASVEAPLLPDYAKVDTELIASIREKAIGGYATYFNPSNRNRAHNIGLAAKAIDSKVVFPGEKFSFNQVVGIRSAAKGYLRAPVIVRGELSEDIGGGICQVSSTLYNAVDRAGLKIVQRYSHSRNVPYVLPGRDATVSWGGPDFVFLNPYPLPVLIRAYASGGQMFVSVYSDEQLEFTPRSVPHVTRRLPQEIREPASAKNPVRPEDQNRDERGRETREEDKRKR
ncbi:VanW family protein [Cohnella zeiphila]|uniref:VanW family protein n=1 Tax=Cohnella zeiphila TaxID=2761120 RepID=A0A7X0SU17_9BACL|nr:VanW family protein [Cohnella zeiphila]MBB6735986.1 VanW family protein [Cohnella zeiphila]